MLHVLHRSGHSTTPSAPAREPLLTARGLGFAASGREILRGIDLAIGRREIVTVIGPNGGGKTTLLKLLLGLVKQTTGRVDRAPGVRVGYLPQRFAVNPVLPLTVSRLMALTRPANHAAIATALVETGSEHLVAARVQDLSGGELQRVMLARALLSNPDLLVLDEPVQGVDVAGEAALYELIGRLRDERGCAVLMVSHDLHVVMAATDRVICLNGHVCCTGAPREVTSDPEYRRLFGARAAEAYAVYRHDHDCDHDHGDGHDHSDVVTDGPGDGIGTGEDRNRAATAEVVRLAERS